MEIESRHWSESSAKLYRALDEAGVDPDSVRHAAMSRPNILRDRVSSGPVPSVEALDRVPGLGPKTVEALRRAGATVGRAAPTANTATASTPAASTPMTLSAVPAPSPAPGGPARDDAVGVRPGAGP